MKQSFELLAPAGTMTALIAALHNGADAVYLGGKLFNARSSAENFELEEIISAVKYAREHDAKIYVTVNTLLHDDEIPEAMEYVGELYAAGVDAVILQDVGFASLVRKAFPHLALHASTQMTVHNSASAKFLEGMGFQRIIAERQMTIEELKKISSEINIELEVFAHGALCVSYSGQCLMSSLIGGRSGNRGRCAQPCRLEYDLFADEQGVINNQVGPYLLSTKDLNLSWKLPQLIESGFSGIKLEGRMKRPEYVATVTRIYRHLIDRYYTNPGEYYVTPEEGRQLEQIFNRDFTSGFLYSESGSRLMSLKRPNNRGVFIGRVSEVNEDRNAVSIKLEKDISMGDVIEIWVSVGGRIATTVDALTIEGEDRSNALAGDTIIIPLEGRLQPGDRVFRTRDHKLISEAQASYKNLDAVPKIPLKARVSVKLQEPMTIELHDSHGRVAKVASDRVGEPAKNYGVDQEVIARQLERTGNTDFYIAEYEWDVEPNIFMPVSIINDMRRKAIEELDGIYSQSVRPADLTESISRMKSLKYSTGEMERRHARYPVPKLAVTVNDLDSLSAASRSGADIIYWGGDMIRLNKWVPISTLQQALRHAKQSHVQLGFAFPRISKDSDLKLIRENLEKELPLDCVRVANLGQLQMRKELSAQFMCIDYPQHTFNSATMGFYHGEGAGRVTLSPELTLEQMKGMRSPDHLELECIIHGQIPVMVTEYCPVSTVCTGPTASGDACQEAYCERDRYALKDKLGYSFPVMNNGQCRTFIMNSKELCLFDNLSEFMHSGFAVLRIEAAERGASYTGQVVSLYRHWLDRFAQGELLDQREMTHAKRVLQDMSWGGITKGHYYRGVE